MAEIPQVPPQALDAEMAVLGSMLIEPEAVETGIDLLDDADFYKTAHRKIYQAILGLHERGQAVDFVTVGEELKKLKSIGEVGGSTYLSELVGKVSTAGHVGYYARIVRDKSLLRSLIREATQIVTRCYNEEKEPGQLLDEAQQRVLQVSQKQKAGTFRKARELSQEVIDNIEKLHQRKEQVTGVSSGLDKVDRMTAGFQKGDLILIAARPSQGKTALALNIAAHVALKESPVPVAIFSMEMSCTAIMTRLVASEARTDLHAVRTGFFKRDRWTDLTNAAARLNDAPLFIDDTPGLSALELRSRARRLMNDLRNEGKQLGLVIIDYLQLMRGSSRRSESRQQEVSEISRSLKALARDLDLPVIALSQLSRRPEDKGRGGDARPQLSDLRESGALEQDADLVAFIYREGYYKRDDPALEKEAEILISKQRNGPTGRVPVTFLPNLARFENKSLIEDPEEEESVQAEFVP